MEPFTILCDTCAARLKVRRASLINQVLACPKCGSMVRVEAPEGWKLEDDTVPSMPVPDGKKPSSDEKPANASQSAQTGDFANFDDIEDVIAGANSDPSGKSGAGTSPPIPKPPQRKRKPTPQKTSGRPSSATTPTGQPPAHADDGPILPDQSWTSSETQRRQRLILIAGSSIAVICLIVAGVIGIMVNSGQTAKKSDQNAESNQQTQQKDSTNEQTDNASESDDNTTNNADEAGSNDSGNQEAQDQTPADDQADSGTDSESTEPNNTTNDTGEGTDQDSTPLVEQRADSGSDQSPPSELDNPLVEKDNNQENALDNPLDNLLEDNTPRDPLFNGGLDDTTELSTRLGELNALLSDSGLSISSIQNLADENRRRTVGVPKYYVQRPDAIKSESPVALSNLISGVHYDGVPLVNFLRETGSLVGTPLSLHVESLTAAGIDRMKPVTITLKDEDLSTALDVALESVDLFKQPIDTGQIVVLAKGWDDLVERSHTPHQLSDTTPAGHANFVRRVRRMFNEKAWTDQTIIEMRGNELFVKQVPQVHYQIDRLLTKLKAVQQLNETPGDQASLETLETEWHASEAARKKTVNFQPGPDLSLQQFIRNLESQTGATILIDWNSLSTNGWTFRTMIPGEFDESNLQDSLFELARSLKCSYRALDANTFELIGYQESDRRPELQVFAVKDILAGSLTAEALLETLARVTQRDSNLVQAGFDEGTQSLVVIAPQHVQLQIEAILSRLGKKSS